MDVLFQFPEGQNVSVSLETIPSQGDRIVLNNASKEVAAHKNWAVSAVTWNLSTAGTGTLSVTIIVSEVSGISN